MLQNAFIYNDDDSEEYAMAKEFRIVAEEKIEAFRATEGSVAIVKPSSPSNIVSSAAKTTLSPRRATRQKRSQ